MNTFQIALIVLVFLIIADLIILIIGKTIQKKKNIENGEK